MLKIISWNVNGIRAILKKGLKEFLDNQNPQIVCLQETKASPNQLPVNFFDTMNYQSIWSYDNNKKGYSGTTIFMKIKPDKIFKKEDINDEILNSEGRITAIELKDFYLFNVYFPNGKQGAERLKYKLEFYDNFLNLILILENEKPVIFCGDINTAHKEIDLARPKENENTSGFLPIEREWIDKVIEAGYLDCFRLFNKEPNNYTWWDLKTRARERNIGWRIDYFFISQKLKPKVLNCYHLTNQMGSDHCPVVLELDFNYENVSKNYKHNAYLLF